MEVERLRVPELVGKPVAVGGKGPRGVIASASYEARRFGVRSAQPTATALRLCPELQIVAPEHGRYRAMSLSVFEVFRSFTPLVEGLSLDEAFLDVRGLRLHFDSPVEIAREIRQQIRTHVGLPASVGIASNKLLAKLASQQAKPDGVQHVPDSEAIDFLHRLPAAALSGVGPATMAALERLGVESVGDIAAIPAATLAKTLGPTLGHHLHELANARDARPVEPDSQAKSISVEETYDTDLTGQDVVETAMLSHAQRLSWRLQRAGLAAKTITLKARYDDFTTITRSKTLAGGIDGARDLFEVATSLLAELDPARPVRLLGLGGSSLEPSDRPRQLDLGHDHSWDSIETAIAEVKERFGEGSVAPARLVERETKTNPKGRGSKSP